MILKSNGLAKSIRLRAPLIVMILAATAIPVDFRPLEQVKLDLAFDPLDILANVVGYVPVGLVLGEFGLLRAGLAAASLTTLAESSQVVMMHRFPSPIDIVSNFIGALLGAAFSLRWGIRSLGFRINRWKALAAVILAFALFLRVSSTLGPGVNAR